MPRKATFTHKPLDSIHDLITMPQEKRSRPNHNPKTVDQITNTLLMQMLTGKSPKVASAALSVIGKILYCFSKELLTKKDPLDALQGFVADHKRDHGEKIFKTSPSTLNTTLGELRSKTADQILSRENRRIQTNLKKQGLWSKKIMLAVDPSHTLYYGKYVNRHINWGTVGQKPLYMRSFKELAVYATTPQLILSGANEPVLASNKWKRPLMPWIREVRNQTMTFHGGGTDVTCIYGDREYYSSLGMAYSRLGLWNPNVSIDRNPRFVVPKKMWGNREDTKWKYLLSNMSKVLKADTIELEYYSQKYLGDRIRTLPRKGNKTRYLVPVWSLAVFDTYGNGKQFRSLSWGKNEAKYIKTKLQESQKALNQTEQKYVTFLQNLGGRQCKPPSYRGRKRKIFKLALEKHLYRACWKAYSKLKYWKSKKTSLCKRLIFFNISSKPNDNRKLLSDEFLKLAEGYHERWGVESGFKDIKYKFHIKTNSRKPTSRHVRFIIGALVYNAWHYYRLLRISRKIKKTKKSWKPFVHDIIPNRKKYERKHGRILEAGCFIHLLLEKSLIFTLKKELARF